jgi:hypothetical protein
MAPTPTTETCLSAMWVLHLGDVGGADSQVPLQASWQDLKDLMRQAGEVIRADIGMTPDGQPKGNGTVVFINPQDAKAAIGMLEFSLTET